MRRRIVRTLTTLALVLSLGLATAASPALAGDSSGAAALLGPHILPEIFGPGDCAYVQSSTSCDFFVAVGRAGPADNNIPIAVIIFRVKGSLPGAGSEFNLNHCQFYGTF